MDPPVIGSPIPKRDPLDPILWQKHSSTRWGGLAPLPPRVHWKQFWAMSNNMECLNWKGEKTCLKQGGPILPATVRMENCWFKYLWFYTLVQRKKCGRWMACLCRQVLLPKEAAGQACFPKPIQKTQAPMRCHGVWHFTQMRLCQAIAWRTDRSASAGSSMQAYALSKTTCLVRMHGFCWQWSEAALSMKCKVGLAK